MLIVSEYVLQTRMTVLHRSDYKRCFTCKRLKISKSTTTCCSYLKKHSVPVLDMCIPNDEVGVTNGCDVLCSFESANKKREKRTQTSESAETKAERICAGRLYLCVLSSRVKHTLSLSGRCVVSLTFLLGCWREPNIFLVLRAGSQKCPEDPGEGEGEKDCGHSRSQRRT